MKGIVYHGQKDIRYEIDLEEPQITSPDEILVDVAYCGICGTDLKEYTDPPNFFANNDKPDELTGLKGPMCMGHEISGTIIAKGDEVYGMDVGDKVAIEPTVFCSDSPRFQNTNLSKDYSCAPCSKGLTNICDYAGICGLGAQDGGLAEKFVTGARHAIVIPESIPLEVGALVQPIAVSWHAVRISGFKEDSSALVLGGGAVGLAAILSCFGHKASMVVCSEPSKRRRESAEKLGAHVFDPSSVDGDPIKELMDLSPKGHGFDYCFDCSGLEITLHTAIRAATTNGTIVNVAIWGSDSINFYPMEITKTEKRLMGSMCYTREDFEGVLDAFEKGNIDVDKTKTMITSVVDLENGVEGGFDHLLANKATEVKILITPNNHGEVEYSKDFTKTHEEYLN